MSSAFIAVRVTPRAGRNAILGWEGDELGVKVTAPPEDGKANAAVCKVVAKRLGVPKSSVSVVRGETSRHKRLEVKGADDAMIDAALGDLPRR